MPHDIFISYSSPDRAYAEALCERLEAGSIRCWIAPRDILPGADWGGSIINAIGQSRAMVLVFSSHANDSQQIPHEVAYAVSAKVPVIQLRIEDVEPNANLRYFLDTSQWLDAFASPFAQHLERIAEAVKVTLEQPREAAHPLLQKASKWRVAHRAIASHWRSLVAGLGLIGFVAFVAHSIGNATNPTVVSIAKFGASVKCLTFSPDGRLVAAGSSDMTARVFEVLGGKEVLKLRLQGTVYGVAFSQDGRYLAVAGGGDKTVRVFTTVGGKEVSRLEVGDRDAVVAVAFSPDGHYVAAGVDDMTARVFEAVGGKEVARVLLGNTVRMVAFSPNGRYVAAGALGWDGGVKVFEAVGGREVSRVKVDDSDAADAVAFSPNGRDIAVGSNNVVRVFEALGGKIVSQLNFRDLVLAVVFGPEGRLVAVSSDDMTVSVFEAVTGRQVWLLEVEVPVVALAFSPDGRYVAAGSKDNTTRVFETASGKEVSRLESHNRGQIGAVAFSPDGRYVGVASSDETARVFETVGDTEAWLLKFQGWFARVGL